MILCVIKQYFMRDYKRWINAFIVLLGLGVILKYISPEGFLHQGQPLVLWDYIFSAFEEPIAMIMVIPILYCYLIGDIIIKDYEGGYITFFLSRISNRVYYFLSKVVLIFIASNIFFIVYLVTLFIVAFIYRLPFSAQYHYVITRYAIESGKSIFSLFILKYGLFIMVLNTLGIFMITISLLFNNCIVGFIGTAFFMIQGHDAIFNNQSRAVFSPLVQDVLWLHSPFYLYINKVEAVNILHKFTPMYSTKFLLVICMIFLVIGCIRIRTMNMCKKD